MSDQGRPASKDVDISLEELSRTYAKFLGGDQSDEDRQAAAAEQPADNDPAADEHHEPAEPPEDPGDVSAVSILEAILFVGHPENRPLSSREIAALMRGVSPQEIDELVAELNRAYAAEGCPYQVCSRGAGYGLELTREFHALRDTFYGTVREARLSQAAIDVLAIVAYQPGLTREEIDQLRGKPSANILALLVRRQLLKLERPVEDPRRPRYHPTERFLELFGLESLEELPRG